VKESIQSSTACGVAERHGDGSRGFQAREEGHAVAAVAERRLRAIAPFKRRDATQPMDTLNRGMNPTATVITSLRDGTERHPPHSVAVANRAKTRVESVVVNPTRPNRIALALMPVGNSTQRKSRAARGKLLRFCNPKGIVSFSPGLRGTSYPGSQAEWISTPTGLCHVSVTEPQPRWGCWLSATFPRVARSSQPWALSRNPFGILLWNFRKALPVGQSCVCLNNS